MPENEKKAPKVINKSGTLKMDDQTAATKQTRDIAGRKMDRKNRRDRVRTETGPKEFEEITILAISQDEKWTARIVEIACVLRRGRKNLKKLQSRWIA